MKWSEQEYFILRVIAWQSAQGKLTPEIIRTFIGEAKGKTESDLNALLKAGAK